MIIPKIKNIFSNTTLPEKLIILLSISLFLPYELTIGYVIFLGIYTLVINIRNKSFKTLLKKTPYGLVLLILDVYFIIVSFVVGNWLGLLISIALFLVFFTYFYYRQYLTLKLFNLVVDVMIFMSVISVGYSIIEQLFYAQELGSVLNFFDIANSPKYRVHAFYFNANFYALMIAMVILLCVYKLLSLNEHSRNNYIRYIIVIALNLFALFLTGSRLAWPAMILGLIFMFLFTKKWLAFSLTLGSVLALVVLILLDVPIIPRFVEYGLSLERRANIYENAFLMMKDTWLFGRGPLTYLFEWPNYVDEYIKVYGIERIPKAGLYSEHTHSIFIEPLVSFGLIGTFFFVFYLVVLLKDILKMMFRRYNAYLSALIISVIICVVIADVIDLAVLWIQTGMLFFMIIGASAIYQEKLNEKGSNENDGK